MNNQIIFILLLLIPLSGCQSAANSEAKSAVQAITNTMQGHVSVKYCPVDGKRYGAHLKICPEHNVELKELE